MKTKNWSKTTRYNFITYAIVIVAYIIMEVMSGFGWLSNSLRGQLVPICTYIILAISLNLTVGVLGELSLGHAGFMSVGAFAGAFFSVCTQEIIPASWVRFPLALLIGGITAGVLGILIGIPVLRLQGDYLAIVTLAFGEIIKNLFNSFYVGIDAAGAHFSLTDTASLGMQPDGKIIINGAMGITGTPKDATFTIGFILILITLFVVLNLMKS
ncbi:MAG: branched-chain amino acid ABC transporter permease, partial [Ruthenibacterium sp.]